MNDLINGETIMNTNLFTKKALKLSVATISLGLLLGEANISSPSPAQAASWDQVVLVKKAYIYNKNGKRTAKSIKKGTIKSIFGTKWIKGKKYYKLSSKKFIRTANARISNDDSSDDFFGDILKEKKQKESSFKKKIMDATGISEAEFNEYTSKGFYHEGNIADAINNPKNYVVFREYKSWDWKDGDTPDEYAVADIVLRSQVEKEEAKEVVPYQGAKVIDSNWENAFKDYFLQFLNKRQNSQGLKSLTSNNPKLKHVSDLRLSEILKQYSHTRPNGERYYTAYSEMGLDKYKSGEILGKEIISDSYESPEKEARRVFEDFVYHDLLSNWGHRDILQSKPMDYKEISVSVKVEKINNKKYEISLAGDLLA